MTKDYVKVGKELGELVNEKQAAYGDSFGRSNEVLKILYPDGVPVEKYSDFLALTRVIDKCFRIATDRDALGESPWRDVAGYALLSYVNVLEEQENKRKLLKVMSEAEMPEGDFFGNTFLSDEESTDEERPEENIVLSSGRFIKTNYKNKPNALTTFLTNVNTRRKDLPRYNTSTTNNEIPAHDTYLKYEKGYERD